MLCECRHETHTPWLETSLWKASIWKADQLPDYFRDCSRISEVFPTCRFCSFPTPEEYHLYSWRVSQHWQIICCLTNFPYLPPKPADWVYKDQHSAFHLTWVCILTLFLRSTLSSEHLPLPDVILTICLLPVFQMRMQILGEHGVWTVLPFVITQALNVVQGT